MAYPPVIPAATRANSTAQLDTHPADHNALATALANVAWGLAGYAKVTANQAISASASPGTAVAGASAAVTTIANRRYRVAWSVNSYADTAGAAAVVSIRRDGVEIVQRGALYPLAGTAAGATFEVIDQPAAGAHTWTVNVWRVAATGNINIFAAATSPAELTVTDVGAV